MAIGTIILIRLGIKKVLSEILLFDSIIFNHIYENTDATMALSSVQNAANNEMRIMNLFLLKNVSAKKKNAKPSKQPDKSIKNALPGKIKANDNVLKKVGKFSLNICEKIFINVKKKKKPIRYCNPIRNRIRLCHEFESNGSNFAISGIVSLKVLLASWLSGFKFGMGVNGWSI